MTVRRVDRIVLAVALVALAYLFFLQTMLASRVIDGTRYFWLDDDMMISMRYGTLPVVRETGGLVDSVPREVGFRFAGATSGDLSAALKLARAEWDDKPGWQERMRAGMALDFSWEASARKYAEVYTRVLEG